MNCRSEISVLLIKVLDLWSKTSWRMLFFLFLFCTYLCSMDFVHIHVDKKYHACYSPILMHVFCHYDTYISHLHLCIYWSIFSFRSSKLIVLQFTSPTKKIICSFCKIKWMLSRLWILVKSCTLEIITNQGSIPFVLQLAVRPC